MNDNEYNDALDPELEDLHIIDGDEPLDPLDDVVLPLAKKPLAEDDEESFDDDTFDFPLEDDEDALI